LISSKEVCSLIEQLKCETIIKENAMKVYFDDYRNEPYRSQPYYDSHHKTQGYYYDLRREPEKIRTHLEEFFPYSEHQSVQDFYALLEWMNGKDSIYETSDCRLGDLKKNSQRDLAQKDFVRSGAFSWFFRDLKLNLSEDSQYFESLFQTYQINENDFQLTPSQHHQDFAGSMLKKLISVENNGVFHCLSIAPFPTYYKNANVRECFRFGCQMAHRYWIWGDSDEEIFESFIYTVKAYNDFSFLNN
jgi:hypothetical protein